MRKAKANGRPTVFKPEYVDLARKFCMLGATNAELARMFGVSGSTLDNWIKDKPTFSAAVKEGREEADAKVASSLFHRATGYSHEAVKIFVEKGRPIVVPYTEHYPPDATSMIFWLKNRRPDLWRDKIEHQHSADEEMLKIFDAACERAKKR